MDDNVPLFSFQTQLSLLVSLAFCHLASRILVANEMLAENEAFISTVVTLDSRRVPLPRSGKIKLLTLRGSDFPADVGVLPTALEQQTLGLCVVTVTNARHDDMYDGGPDWLKTKLKRLLKDFLVTRQAGGGQGNYPSC
jgi:hypothetical protein